MLKKISIYILSVFVLGINTCSALIQVSDWIFENNESSWNTSTTTNTNTITTTNTWSTKTWTIITWELKSNLWTWLSEDIDFVMWIKWMNENWLTSYKDINTYRPYDKVTREEMAKILGRLYDVDWVELENSNTGCVFQDAKSFNIDLSPYIYKVCSLNIMKWANWKFLPSKTITRAEGLVTIIRLFEGKKLDETQTPWYKSYYDRWIELWFIPTTMKLKDMEIWLSRYRTAKLVYSFHIQNNFRWYTQQTDTSSYTNFVDLVTDSVFLDDDKNLIMKLHIQKSSIINWSTSQLPILLDNGNIFKAIKITTTQRSSDRNSFVRYADVYDNSNWLAWSMTVIISNWIIREWYLRFTSWIVYKIEPAVDSSTDNIYDVIKRKY